MSSLIQTGAPEIPRVSLRAMTMPTTAEVAGAGDRPFKAKNWRELSFPSQISEDEFPDVVRRHHVFEAYRRSIEEGIVWTIVWGYPSGTITGHREGIQHLFENVSDTAKAVRQFQDAPGQYSALEIIVGLRGDAPRIACSTTSKIAYTAGIVAAEGPCTVYDLRVIRSIMQGRYTEFADLEKALPSPRAQLEPLKRRVESAIARQNRTYGAYVSTMTHVSEALGICSDQLEYFVFNDVAADD